MSRDIVQELIEFNRPFAQRNAELIRLKIARMAEGPFAFFRGTFHLYARDVIQRLQQPLPLLSGEGTALDLVGDLHAENYGAFKADDGVVHYDVNDFDETTQGRFDFDVCRLATSWFLAARERDCDLTAAIEPLLAGLGAYVEVLPRLLKKGKDEAHDVQAGSPCGCKPIEDILAAGENARRPAFIQAQTVVHRKGRALIRSSKIFNLPEEDQQRARRLLADYLHRQSKEKDAEGYYAIEDVCGRIAGVGSMGRYRYVVLVTGKSSAEGRNVLLEFKEARPSAYDLYRGKDTDAGALVHRAARVIEVQKESQAASNRHLGHAVDGDLSFQVRELGPADGRIDNRWLKDTAAAECTARIQAGILARIHARAAIRAVGPTNPLAELADGEAFCQRVLAFALGYADVVQRDFQRFVGARAQLDDVASWAR
jgi:uncharacterized protein (DUF2252 family)